MSDRTFAVNIVPTQPLASAAVYTTPLVDIRTAKHMVGIRMRTLSAGAPDVKVEMDLSEYPPLPAIPTHVTSPQPNTDAFPITLLASSNTTFTGSKDWRMIIFKDLTPPITDSPSKFARFRFTGVGANPADTVLDAKLILEESL